MNKDNKRKLANVKLLGAKVTPIKVKGQKYQMVKMPNGSVGFIPA